MSENALPECSKCKRAVHVTGFKPGRMEVMDDCDCDR